MTATFTRQAQQYSGHNWRFAEPEVMSNQGLQLARRVKDGAFHFWDAVDDFSRTNMDLIFEHDRLYLHDASGHFGAVPMSITGTLCCSAACTFLRAQPQL